MHGSSANFGFGTLNGRNVVDRADVPDEAQQIRHGEFAWRLGRKCRLPVLPLPPEIRLMVAVHDADEDFGHKGRTDRTQPLALAALLRLFEDVVPKRRVLMQAVLLGDLAVVALRDLVGRERVLDAHRPGDVLSGWQPEQHTALEIAERKAAAIAR